MTEWRKAQLREVYNRKREADSWRKIHRPTMRLDDYKRSVAGQVGRTFQLDDCAHTYTVEKFYPFFVQCRARAAQGGFTWLESFSYPEIYRTMRGGM